MAIASGTALRAIALYQKSLLLIYHLHPVHPLIMVILILTNLVLTSRNNYCTLMLLVGICEARYSKLLNIQHRYFHSH